MLRSLCQFAAISGLGLLAAGNQPTEPKIRALLQPHDGGPRALSFSPDSKLLAVACPNNDKKEGVKIWDVAAIRCLKILDGYADGVVSLAFSPDGKTLAVAPWRGPVVLYDVATWTPGRSFQTPKKGVFQGMHFLAFTPDSKALLTFDQNREIALWNVASGEKITTVPHDFAGAIRVLLSPDGKNVAVGGYDKLFVWSLTDKKVRWRLDGQLGALYCLAFSPDSKLLIGAGAVKKGPPWGQAFVWDMETGKAKQELGTDKRYAHFEAVAISHDSKIVALAGAYDLSFWNAATGQHIREIQVGRKVSNVLCVAYSPDGKTLAVGYSANVALYDLPKD